MKHLILATACAAACLASIPGSPLQAAAVYTPSPEIRKSQQDFSDERFGIFIHWGIYSMFGQGEWYLNYGPRADEYAKAARAFYPADFDAGQWARAIKDAGAGYVCFTSRHHDGFSMWDTDQSDYNIVKATPFRRDVLKELAEALHNNDLALHLYYSHIDWTRTDYPWGRTGHRTGRDSLDFNWPQYYGFMNRQLTELLTGYGPVRAIWFDGKWDHDQDSIPFDWQLDEQYALVHRLQPGCMVANNHHENIYPGEDIQIFERDLPGENTAGYSEQDISRLPLETCNTMNGMWGYKLVDTDYKDTPTLIRYLVKAAGIGANLLLNIGPQPNGELPAAALDRLRGIGEWMRANGETIRKTQGGPFPPQPWGVATARGKTLFIHVTGAESPDIVIPKRLKIKKAVEYASGRSVAYTSRGDSTTLHLGRIPDAVDHIIRLELK